MFVGGLGGPVSAVKLGLGGQLKWVSSSPLMCALLILRYAEEVLGSLFILIRMSWITAAVRYVVGGRLTQVACLLILAGNLGIFGLEL